MDEKAAIEGEIKWLDQMVSFLTLNSTNPSTDVTVQATLKIAGEKKEKRNDIVGLLVCSSLIILMTLYTWKGETTDSLGEERSTKERWTLRQKLGCSLGFI